MSGTLPLIRPDWPVQRRVRSAVTTRYGGVSLPPWDSLNLGDHVGDDPQAVAENRRRLHEALQLPAEPLWLSQVHGCAVADAASDSPGCEADAAFADRPGVVCAVLTADCLPLLICDAAGEQVAAVHAGWRGLAGGVVEQAVARFAAPPEAIHVWLGPAIGPDAFEVGEEVREAFMAHDHGASDAFRPSPTGRWLADIYTLARRRLALQGIRSVSGGGFCTYSESRFYSYRRDGQTGRMASLIWLED